MGDSLRAREGFRFRFRFNVEADVHCNVLLRLSIALDFFKDYPAPAGQAGMAASSGGEFCFGSLKCDCQV